MNIAQKITIGITLIIMSIVSFIWSPWGMRDITRKYWGLIADLLSILLLGGAVFIFFSLIKKKPRN